MVDRIAEPLPIEYDGWDAIEHRVDAQKLGLSLQGISRINRTTSHFYLTGRLPARLKRSDVRILAGPPRQSSITYLIWLMMAHGQMAMYPQLLAEFADLCIPEFIKAMLAKQGKQPKALEDAIEKLHDLAKENAALANRFADFATDVHSADQVDKERLYGLIDRLAQKNSSAMIETVAPVGDSVKTLTLAKQKPAEFVIDEPIADTIRAMGNLDVQDAVEMVVRLTAVDTVSRTVKMTSPQHKKSIKAKIIDPALMQPQNAYTRALDHHKLVRITAKPVLKDDELYMYYISDAKSVEE